MVQRAEGAGSADDWWTQQVRLNRAIGPLLVGVTDEIAVQEAVRDYLYNFVTDLLVWPQGRNRAAEEPTEAAKLVAAQEAFLASSSAEPKRESEPDQPGQ